MTTTANAPDAALNLARPSAIKRALTFCWENKALTIGLVMLAIVFFCMIFAPFLSPYGPDDQEVRNRLKPGFWDAKGSPGHLLGTDGVGRDLWSRILHSLRVSLPIATAAVIITVVVGLMIALFAGTFGGWVDAMLMRLVEVQMAFPFIVLALAILSNPETNACRPGARAVPVSLALLRPRCPVHPHH